jgi:2-dehydro-3-deoxyglucarate aldolase/4-hydroxy-2-oxoheptanedioate aldolase
MFSRDIASVEIAAAAGLDFIILDLEHRPQNPETVHDICQAARLAGVAPIVGPKDITAHAISHVLDLGASGVLIPHVETVEDVAVAIEATRYPPKGRRGRCNRAGHNLYDMSPLAEEVVKYNDDVSLFLKVEAGPALEAIDELIAPDEVDGVTVGPVDLSLDMGIPGQTKDPRIVELIENARRACLEKGLKWGDHVMSPGEIPAAVEKGASWVIVSGDLDILYGFWSQSAQAARNLKR